MDFRTLQEDVAEWSYKNFGDQEATNPLLGVVEEVGELCHAVLKSRQKIRKGEDHVAGAQDAVGDIVIYLADFCTRYNIDFDKAVTTAWDEVKVRDWTKERAHEATN